MVEEPHRATRKAMERAIRRLNVLEYLILAAAAFLALGGGALAAFLLSSAMGLPFRASWAVASILLFVLPAAVVYGRERRSRRTRRTTHRTEGEQERDVR